MPQLDLTRPDIPRKSSTQFNSLLYYKIDDIQATYETLCERGVSFDADGGVPHKIADMEDHELWMAFLRDSEKNLVGLMCEVRNS